MKNLRLSSVTNRHHNIIKADFACDTWVMELKKIQKTHFHFYGLNGSKTLVPFSHVTKRGVEHLKSPFVLLDVREHKSMLFSSLKRGAKQHLNIKYELNKLHM